MSGEIANTALIVCLVFALLWLASKCQGLRERVERLEQLAGIEVRDPTNI